MTPFVVILKVFNLSIVITLAVFTSLTTAASQATWHEAGKPKSQFIDTFSMGYHRQNWAITTDKKGRIYVLNRNGILLYDGVKWDDIVKSKKHLFSDFALSDDGKIYTSANNTLGYYHGNANGSWQFVSIEGDSKLPVFDRVHRIITHKQHTYYLSNQYLFHYHPHQGLRWIKTKQGRYLDIIQLKDTLYLSSTMSPLCRFSIKDKVCHPAADLSILPSSHIKGAIQHHKAKLFITSSGLYSLQNQSIERFDQGLERWLNNNTIRSFLLLPDGRIVLGSRNKGIAILKENGELDRLLSKKHGLKENWITGITVDHNNDLWVSHGSQGVSRIEPNSISYFDDSLGAEKLEVIARHNHQLFIGSLTEGLSILIPAKSLNETSYFKKVSSFFGVWALHSHADGLFVGHTNGISLININKDKVVERRDIYNGNTVYDIVSPRHNTDVIYATSSGLIKLEKIDGRWLFINQLKDFSVYSRALIEDKFQGLWVISHSGSLHYVSQLQLWPDAATQSISNRVLPATGNSIIPLDDMLIIANEHGYYCIEDNGKIASFNAAENWPQSEYTFFKRYYKESQHRLWVTNGNQLSLIARRDDGQFQFSYPVLGHPNLQGIFSIHHDWDKTLWVGGSFGLVRIDPSYRADPTDKQTQQLHIHKVSSLHSDRLFIGPGSEQHTQIVDPLPVYEQNVRIDFGSSNYRDTNHLEFRYRLLGYNNTWSNWTETGRAEFTHLPAGHFNFEFQSKDKQGKLSDIANLQFSRSPYWYEYWLSKVLFFIVALVFIAGVIRYSIRIRTRQMKQHAEHLEREIAFRTKTISCQNQELTRLNQARTRFFTHVSHELRTPLTLTIGPLDEVLKGRYGRLAKPVDDALKLVSLSAQSMLELINQVLDLNRMESGSVTLGKQPVKIDELAQECAIPFTLLAKKNRITFLLNFHCEGVIVDADPKGLKSIINNLLNNAFKFTAEGGEIGCSIEVDGKNISINVSDTGCGIDQEELPHIFDQYYQAKSHTHTSYSGTGIGLAMVREYAELHNGAVSVSSEIGSGSCFTVTFPANVTSDRPGHPPYDMATVIDPEFARLKSPQRECQVEHNDTPTVLIAEDNSELRQFLSLKLNEHYRVLSAENGQQAFSQAQLHLPDLIISDIMMPEVDGLQFCKMVKSNQDTSCIPFLLLTAMTTETDIVNGLNFGADDYISKPFRVEELMARVHRLIESRKQLKLNYTNAISNTADPNNTCNCDDDSDNLLLRVKKIVLHEQNAGINVAELADKLAMDRTTLYRKIKHSAGKPPAELIKTIRLEEAARLLKTRDVSVGEIAYAVGFNSLGHFSRSFSAHFTVTPNEYKKEHKRL